MNDSSLLPPPCFTGGVASSVGSMAVRSARRPARFRRSSARLHAFVLGAAFAGLIPAARAAGDTWDNGGLDKLWQTPANWSADSAFPGATSGYASVDDATFGAAGAGGVIQLGGSINVRTLIFGVSGGDAAAFTIGGATDALNFTSAGGVTVNAGVTTAQTVGVSGATINLSTAAAAATTFTNIGAGLLTIAGNLVANTASGNGLLSVGGSGNTAVTGTVTKPGAGSQALLKTGAGTLTLSNGSVWSGAGALGRIPATAAGFPLVAREGTLLLAGGTHAVTGELVIGGVVADGGAGQNARLQVDAGALTISTWLSVGRGNGVGAATSDLVLNNAATVATGNVSAGFNGGNAANLPKGSITLNGTSSLGVNTAGAFFLAESAGSNFTMTLNDSSVVTLNGNGTAVNRSLGHLGTGTLHINGSASFADASNAALNIGYQNGAGVVNLNSGVFAHANGEVRVGASNTNGAFTGSGTLNVLGGVATVGSLTLARGNNNAALLNGTVNVGGGTLTSTGDVVVGYAGAGNRGQINLSGGVLNIGTTAGKWLQVGMWDTTKGEVNITGGALNLNSSSAIKMNRQTGTGANVITQSGGTVTFYSDNATTVGGTGDLDLQYVGAAASNNTYHLNGGTLTVPKVTSTATTGTRTFNFNGGTLRATGSSATFFNLGSGSARANVRNGGAFINSNGFDVTVAQPLVHSNIGGDAATDGGLTKSGLGTLTLSGAGTYNGPTIVEAGTLALGSAASLASASYSIANGAVFDVSALAVYDLSAVGVSIALDQATAGFFKAGAATLGGGLTLSFSTPSLVGGTTYNLFDYASQTGDFSGVSLAGSFGGSLSRSGEVWSGVSGAYQFSFNEIDGVLTVGAVPEPAACAALGGALALGLVAVRRRRRG